MRDRGFDEGTTLAAAMRVLVFVGSFEPGFRGGGAVRSVARVVDTAPADVHMSVVTRDRDLGGSTPYPGLSGRWVPRGRASVFYLETRRLTQLARLVRELRTVRYDVLYLNSLWSPGFTVLPVLATRMHLLRVRRIVIAPRGELSPGALSLRSAKKSCFLAVWRPFLIRSGVHWHASTDAEAADIQAVFKDADIEISLNQVDLPEEPLEAGRAIGPSLRLGFVGRISPKKNLLMALVAMQGLTVPASLDIFGPAEDPSYWSQCLALIDAMPPHVSVAYRGTLLPWEVPATFTKYDAFVFPTLGENFGHVIAESLSASCPVICSAETPWTDILQSGGGVVVQPLTVEGLRAELQRLADLSAAEREGLRRSAGTAYRTWRKSVSNQNVFDQARHRWAGSEGVSPP